MWACNDFLAKDPREEPSLPVVSKRVPKLTPGGLALSHVILVLLTTPEDELVSMISLGYMPHVEGGMSLSDSLWIEKVSPFSKELEGPIAKRRMDASTERC